MIPNPAVVAHSLGDELILLLDDQFYSLNPTGSELWRLLAAGAGLDRIHAELLTRYEIEDGPLKAEIDRLLGELVAANLVLKGGTE